MSRRGEIDRLLAAALDDDHDLEHRPAEKVRADLEMLGHDPARAVALAKVLAERPASPAAHLLGSLAEDDDAAEIEAMERAPIEEVRARVPGDVAAAVAASVRRQVGATSRVVPFRRRLRVVGIGGSLVGLAAALALVVLTERSDVPEHAADAVQFSEAEPEAAKAGRAARTAERETAAKAPAAPAAAPPAELRAERAAAPEPATSVARALSDEAVTGLRPRAEQQVAPTAVEAPALLLVDPARAPERWRTLSLPEGELEERLPAARRVAEGRRIVALVAYRAEARRREAVIVLGRAEDEAAADRSGGTLPEVLGPLPEGFEVLPLD